MGRSRGGLTSKIHVLVDADGRPVNLRLTGGQVAVCTEAVALMEALGEGNILLADKGYDTNAIRAKAPNERPGPTFRRRPTAKACSSSRAGFTGSGTSWSVSLTGSSSSVVLQPDTTNTPKTIWPP